MACAPSLGLSAAPLATPTRAARRKATVQRNSEGIRLGTHANVWENWTFLPRPRTTLGIWSSQTLGWIPMDSCACPIGNGLHQDQNGGGSMFVISVPVKWGLGALMRPI